MKSSTPLPTFLFLLCLFTHSPGQESARISKSCDSLAGHLFLKECNATLAGCLLQKEKCPLALRLDAFRSWLDSLGGKACSAIVRDIEERYQCMIDTTTYRIDTAFLSYVGNADARVSIIMYVSLSCPLCKRVYREIRNAVISGSLKGKARLAVKPFSSSSWDIALLAAAKVEKQEELLLSLADTKARVTDTMILEKMNKLGIPKRTFQDLIANKELRKAAELSHLEGVRNGVKVTPTVFLNGRRYRSYKDARWVIDAAAYAFEANTPQNGSPKGRKGTK